MKAVVIHEFGGPEVLKYEDVPDPAPGTGEVLVRVKAAGVNPSDTYLRSGTFGRRPTLPLTPGGDCAGTVEVLGPGVQGIEVGDRVYVPSHVGGASTGTYAELVVRAAAGVFPLPDEVTFSQGAGIGVPCGTAYHALFDRGRAKAGETAFVHGASGAVGIASVQLAKAAGLKVIGSAGTDTGRALVAEQGADHVLDHTKEGYFGELSELTGGSGPDLIVEMLADVNLGKDLEVVAKFGRIAIVGARGDVQINPRLAMQKEADILGVAPANLTDDEKRAIHEALGEALRAGHLRPVVREEIPMKDAPRAHAAVMAPGAHGKIVLVP
jgi:NADPH2:quinone reductase